MRYRDRLRIWESNYGRADGWEVEFEGRTVAALDDSRVEDMFWISYRLTPTTDDAVLARRLLTETFWTTADPTTLAFRSRATGMSTSDAVVAAQPFVGPGRINMRGLYIQHRRPLPWDFLVLKIRHAVSQWLGSEDS